MRTLRLTPTHVNNDNVNPCYKVYELSLLRNVERFLKIDGAPPVQRAFLGYLKHVLVSYWFDFYISK